MAEKITGMVKRNARGEKDGVRRKNMEYVQLTLDDWIQMKQRLKQELLGVKQSFVRIGYVLRKIEDQKLYERDGYKSIAEFAQAEYGLGPSITSRFISINREYSIDGYSEHLREEYADLGRSQLEEMLKLPDSDRQMIQPETSREDIRELKRFNKAEPAAGEADDLSEVLKKFYQENEEICKNLKGKLFEESTVNRFAEIVNPGGNRSYRKGLYFLMMYENRVTFKKFGETPKNLTWWEFCKMSYEVILTELLEKMEEEEEHGEETGERVCEDTEASVDTCQGPGTEPKRTDPSPVAERTAEPHVQRRERSGSGENQPVQPERPENTGDCAGAKAKEKQEIPDIPEELSEDPEDVPEQTELTEDFSKYCPTQTRKAYIDTLSTADAAVYISHGLNVVILAYPEKVQEWLEQEVDSKGEAIEKKR